MTKNILLSRFKYVFLPAILSIFFSSCAFFKLERQIAEQVDRQQYRRWFYCYASGIQLESFASDLNDEDHGSILSSQINIAYYNYILNSA